MSAAFMCILGMAALASCESGSDPDSGPVGNLVTYKGFYVPSSGEGSYTRIDMEAEVGDKNGNKWIAGVKYKKTIVAPGSHEEYTPISVFDSRGLARFAVIAMYGPLPVALYTPDGPGEQCPKYILFTAEPSRITAFYIDHDDVAGLVSLYSDSD